MLSLKRYGWMCVLGGQVVYWACLFGGYLPWRTIRGIELHHALFETLPWFSWGNWSSYLWGAVLMFVFSWIFAWYIVWMHNFSLVRSHRE